MLRRLEGRKLADLRVLTVLPGPAQSDRWTMEDKSLEAKAWDGDAQFLWEPASSLIVMHVDDLLGVGVYENRDLIVYEDDDCDEFVSVIVSAFDYAPWSRYRRLHLTNLAIMTACRDGQFGVFDQLLMRFGFERGCRERRRSVARGPGDFARR